MNLELLNIGDIQDAKYNPRNISEENLKGLQASIEKFGYVEPIIVNQKSKNKYTVIGGHQRLAVLRENIAIDQVQCVVLELDEKKEKELNITLNNRKIQGEFDPQALESLIKDITFEVNDPQTLKDLNLDSLAQDLNLDFNLDPDFNLEPEGDRELRDEEEVPEVEEKIFIKKGDLVELGEHRLLCGDSTKLEDVEKLMQGNRATLLHADPPYGMGKEKEGIQNDNLYREKLDKFQMEWFRAFRKSLKDNASCYIWGNAKDLWRLWYNGGLKDVERLTFRNEIVWDKGDGGRMVGGEIMRSYQPSERCLFFMLGEQGFNNIADNYWEGWESIRKYLCEEKEKTKLSYNQLTELLNTAHKHYWVKSQWAMITEKHYKTLQEYCKSNNINAFQREYDSLKKEFYATRAYFNNTHDNMTDVWRYNRVQGEERHGHATPKPVEMITRVLKSSSKEHDIVIEPFLGSGSTLIACEKTQRKCYGIEIDPSYCQVVLKRYLAYTDSENCKINGKPFTL